MHELSIAMNILDIAAIEAGRHEGTVTGATVTAIHLKLGPLSGVVKDALLSAWDIARRRSPLAEAELIVEETTVVGYCPACDSERSIVSLQEFRCSQCGASITKVLGGRELEITALEIDS
jgi:hydrogenase nickel incorporation protein HypA/HybF